MLTITQHLHRKVLSFKNGSRGWIRTSDQVINSHLRYRCATREYGWSKVRLAEIIPALELARNSLLELLISEHK